MREDEKYMQRCLELAKRGLGNVAPNPMVGAVIVHEGTVIGEGWHEKFGGPHAEVNAINSIPENMRLLIPESTLYVNLEPCAHHGKTPPCADLVIKNKFKRVVIGSTDPFPKVSGRGIEKIRAANISVETGILEENCSHLNRRFFTAHTKHRPYVFLKWAESEDGFIAPRDKKQVWLTGDEARAYVHTRRAEEQAILVGYHTVQIDDPELTVRYAEGRNPVRITIDRTLALSPDKKIFRSGAQTYIYNEIKDEIIGTVHRIKIDFTKSVPVQILNDLYARGIHSLIIEGGPTTLGHFINEGLWDEAEIFTAPKKLGEGVPSPKISGISISKSTLGNDTLTVYKKAD